MAVHQIRTCDLCGSSYEQEKHIFGLITVGNVVAFCEDIEFPYHIKEYDLCSKCAEELNNYLMERQKK